MRYLLALLIPPVAVLACQASLLASLVNGFLWLIAFPGVVFGFVGPVLYLVTAVHACLVVSQFYQDRRTAEIKAAVQTALALQQKAQATDSASSAVVMPPNYDPARDVYRL